MKRKTKKAPAAKPPLARLLNFLNWDTEPSLRSRSAPTWDLKTKKVQAELQDDIQKLLDPPPIPRDARVGNKTTPTEFWLSTIVEKIEWLDIQRAWYVVPLPDPLFRDERNACCLGKERFVVINPALPDSVRESVYSALGSVLTSGEFSSLRRCPGCLIYFATTRGNKRFCTRKCTTAFQNKIRLGPEGYFSNNRNPEDKDGSKETQKRNDAERLYRQTVYGNLSRTNTPMYNRIQREIGRGDEASGHKEIAKWYHEKRSFGLIGDRERDIFIKYAPYLDGA